MNSKKDVAAVVSQALFDSFRYADRVWFDLLKFPREPNNQKAAPKVGVRWCPSHRIQFGFTWLDPIADRRACRNGHPHDWGILWIRHEDNPGLIHDKPVTVVIGWRHEHCLTSPIRDCDLNSYLVALAHFLRQTRDAGCKFRYIPRSANCRLRERSRGWSRATNLDEGQDACQCAAPHFLSIEVGGWSSVYCWS